MQQPVHLTIIVHRRDVALDCDRITDSCTNSCQDVSARATEKTAATAINLLQWWRPPQQPVVVMCIKKPLFDRCYYCRHTCSLTVFITQCSFKHLCINCAGSYHTVLCARLLRVNQLNVFQMQRLHDIQI